MEKTWDSEQAQPELKKRILRCLIEEIIVDRIEESGELLLTLHWRGGIHTETRVKYRSRGYSPIHTPTNIVEAIKKLSLICPDEHIALYLSRNGLLTGKGMRWTQQRVCSVRHKRHIKSFSKARKESEGWLTLTEAAKMLRVSTRTLRLAIEGGEIKGEHPLNEGPWVINRKDIESEAEKDNEKSAKRRVRYHIQDRKNSFKPANTEERHYEANLW